MHFFFRSLRHNIACLSKRAVKALSFWAHHKMSLFITVIYQFLVLEPWKDRQYYPCRLACCPLKIFSTTQHALIRLLCAWCLCMLNEHLSLKRTVFSFHIDVSKKIMIFFPDRIGRRYYGHQNIEVSKPFVTTRWFTLWHFPLLPLGSFRMVVSPHESQLAAQVKPKLRYCRLERRPLQWLQVLRVYLMVFLNLALPIAAVYLIISWF